MSLQDGITRARVSHSSQTMKIRLLRTRSTRPLVLLPDNHLSQVMRTSSQPITIIHRTDGAILVFWLLFYLDS